MKRKQNRDYLLRIQRILLIIMVIVVVVVLAPTFKEKKGAQITTQAVKLRLENIGELATQDAYVTSVNTMDKSQTLFGSLEIPFTQTKYIYSYNCKVKAGYDFDKIQCKVDNAKKTITITLPEAKILSTEVDTDSFKVYYEQNSIFTPVTLKENNKALKSMKEDAKKQAIENGILKEARKNAKSVIRSFMEKTYGKEYTYKVQ